MKARHKKYRRGSDRVQKGWRGEVRRELEDERPRETPREGRGEWLRIEHRAPVRQSSAPASGGGFREDQKCCQERRGEGGAEGSTDGGPTVKDHKLSTATFREGRRTRGREI